MTISSTHRLTITIRQGTASRTVPAVSVAALFGLSGPQVEEGLHWLLHPDEEAPDLLHPESPSMEEGGRGEEARSETSTSTIQEIETERSERSEGSPLLPGQESSPSTPEEIASLLGDEKSLGAIRKLVAKHPPRLIEEALQATLLVPPEKILKSRGAYFTATLRALASKHMPSAYA